MANEEERGNKNIFVSNPLAHAYISILRFHLQNVIRVRYYQPFTPYNSYLVILANKHCHTHNPIMSYTRYLILYYQAFKTHICIKRNFWTNHAECLACAKDNQAVWEAGKSLLKRFLDALEKGLRDEEMTSRKMRKIDNCGNNKSMNLQFQKDVYLSITILSC